MFSDKTCKGLGEAGKDWGEERQGEKAWIHGECWHGWHHRAANLEAKEADCSCALLSLAKGGPAGRCGVLSDLSK